MSFSSLNKHLPRKFVAVAVEEDIKNHLVLNMSAYVPLLLQTLHEIGEFGLKFGGQKYNGLNFLIRPSYEATYHF